MDNICRTCGKSSKDALASIFLASRYTLKFADMIKECTSVHIASPDELSKLICIDCQNRLEISYSFKRQCLEIDQKLKDIGINSKSFQNIPDQEELKQEVIITSYDYLDKNSIDENSDIKNAENPQHQPEDFDKTDSDEDFNIPDDNSDNNSIDDNSEIKNAENPQDLAEDFDKTDSDEDFNIPDDNSDNNSDSEDDDESDDNSEHDNNLGSDNAKKSPPKRQRKRINCKYCVKTFEDNKWFFAHMTKMHHPEHCVRCCKPFNNEQEIPEHMKTHEGDLNGCTCFVCGKVHTDLRKLRAHVKLIHPDGSAGYVEKIIQWMHCEECNEDFSNYCAFEDHAKKKHPMNQFECEYCDKLLPPEKSLAKHIGLHLTRKHCDRCLLNFDSKEALIEHKKTHSNDPLPFKCLKCGEFFDSRPKLKKHLWDHLVNNPECPICGKPFTQKYMLVHHMRLFHLKRILKNKRVVRKPKCTECKKLFQTKKLLLEHFKLVHTHKQDILPCSKCDSFFTRKQSLNLHMVRYHDFRCKRCMLKCYSQDSLKEHMKTHLNQTKTCICRYCGKEFNRPPLLLRHLVIHSGEKSYICQFCGHAFADYQNLTTHVRIHTGETRYECKICGKKFVQGSSLWQHGFTHEKEKQFKCEHCGAEYKRIQTLRRHVRIQHLGKAKKMWTCKVCGKSVVSSRKLAHLRKHSGERPHKCPICDRGLTTAWSLKTHMKTHSDSKGTAASTRISIPMNNDQQFQ